MFSPPERNECIGEAYFHDPGGQDVGHPPAHIPSTSDVRVILSAAMQSDRDLLLL
jgi:hypothetical protein